MLSAVVLLVAAAAIIGARLLKRGSPQGASGQGPDADPVSAAFSDKVNPQHHPGAAGARTKSGSDETVAGRHDTATQFEAYPSGAAWADLVVGLDFGTSCTKVVVQSPFLAGARAVAVPWCGDRGGDSYLLPTELCRSMHGDLHLHPGGDGGDTAGGRYSDIKTSLMDRSADERSRAVAAAYLGLVLRRARRWFLDTQADIYGRYSLRWAMNLGIPSAGYDDERVQSTFGLVARAAWALSLSSEAPTIKTAARAYHNADVRGAPDSETPIDVVPEIRPRALPKPATLVNEDAPDGRLDVAYGLSFDRFDIGEIHRPAEIPDVDPPLPADSPDISKDALQ